MYAGNGRDMIVSILFPDYKSVILYTAAQKQAIIKSAHREQKVDIYFRFRVAVASAVLSRKDYGKKEQAA